MMLLLQNSQGGKNAESTPFTISQDKLQTDQRSKCLKEKRKRNHKVT